MAMAMRPTLTLQDLLDFLEDLPDESGYPFYGVLIYPPLNGLNKRLHEYVVSHWDQLNDLTGDKTLVVTLENIPGDRAIDTFKPAEVYAIAREMGASTEAVPCFVLFTDPKRRRDVEVLWLKDLLPEHAEDEDITEFFQRLQSILDACAVTPVIERMSCLQEALDRAWPDVGATTTDKASTGGLLASFAAGASILASLANVVESIR